jgi:transposase
MADKGKRRRRQFTPEFKRDAVELVRASGRPIAHIAAELGIYDSTLGAWVKQAEIDHGEREGLTSQDKTRLRELEAENARLRMERDLLKRRCPRSPSHGGGRRFKPLPRPRCDLSGDRRQPEPTIVGSGCVMSVVVGWGPWALRWAGSPWWGRG